MWQLYIVMLASGLLFGCLVPMGALRLMGLRPHQVVLFLCISTASVLAANLLLFSLIRNRARKIVYRLIERAGQLVDLPDACRNVKPSMEIDVMETVFYRLIREMHDMSDERVKAERNGTLASIASLIAALESRDKYTQNHSARVAALSSRIGREMGMPAAEIERIRLAALLHDVGKIGIRDAVLLKEGPLTDEEYSIIKAHPRIAGSILRPLKGLGPVIDLIVCHHERPDGRGYPARLSQDQVPLGAFIIAAADTYDAMTIDRPYRIALPADKVISELIFACGTQLHEEAVHALCRVMIREDRLGLPVALTRSAWADSEQAAARAAGHTPSPPTEQSVDLEAIVELTKVIQAIAPEPVEEPVAEDPARATIQSGDRRD